MVDKKKIAVIGPGAIGGLMGGYLSQAGEEVVFLGKEYQIRVLRERGLKIEGVRGEMTYPVSARAMLGEEEVQLIVLAVKTQDVVEAAEQQCLQRYDCPVVTLQNGVRADKILSQLIDPLRIVSGIAMFGATSLIPGTVVHNFEGTLILGNYHKGKGWQLEEAAGIVQKAFSVVLTEDIMGMKWLKLFLNLNNCFPALTGKSMQECFAEVSLCEMAIALLREGLELVDKVGIRLSSLPDYPVERLRTLVSLPLEESSRMFSKIMTGLSQEPLYGSVLQSIMRGKPSEIDYINGEFVSLARDQGMAAPLNEKVVEMVHGVEKTRRFYSPVALMGELRELSKV